MAKKRTKKDKQRARQARVEETKQPRAQQTSGEQTSTTFSYAYKASLDDSANQSRSKKNQTSDTSLLKVDQQFILRDLIKTVVISLILLSSIFGIYIYLGYN